jgi:hypothetical protein
MRRKCLILYPLIIALLLMPYSGCQKQTEMKAELKTEHTETKKPIMGAPDANGPSPKIKVDKVVLDFGKVGPGTKSTGKIKISNTGEGVLKISKVSNCCGLVTKLEKREYAPGESGTLNVIYNASGQTGKFLRNMVVHSNDATNPSVRLTIKADIVPKVVCKPKSLKLFLDEENAGCEKLTIKSLDDQPFAITSIKSTANCITADFDPTAKAAEFVLDLKVDMEKIQNNHKGGIDFTLTHPEGKSAYVRFNVIPKYTVKQPLVILFNCEPKKPIQRNIWIYNNYGEDFEIESAISQNNLIKVVNKSKVDNGYQLDLEITPPEKGNNIKFTDTLGITIKGDKRLKVACNGYYARSKTSPTKK